MGVLKVRAFRRMARITPYSRIGHSPSVRHEVRCGFGEAFQFSGKREQPDTSAPTKRIAPGDFVALTRWDVVNTITLTEITSKLNTVGGINDALHQTSNY